MVWNDCFEGSSLEAASQLSGIIAVTILCRRKNAVLAPWENIYGN